MLDESQSGRFSGPGPDMNPNRVSLLPRVYRCNSPICCRAVIALGTLLHGGMGHAGDLERGLLQADSLQVVYSLLSSLLIASFLLTAPPIFDFLLVPSSLQCLLLLSSTGYQDSLSSCHSLSHDGMLIKDTRYLTKKMQNDCFTRTENVFNPPYNQLASILLLTMRLFSQQRHIGWQPTQRN